VLVLVIDQEPSDDDEENEDEFDPLDLTAIVTWGVPPIFKLRSAPGRGMKGLYEKRRAKPDGPRWHAGLDPHDRDT